MYLRFGLAVLAALSALPSASLAEGDERLPETLRVQAESDPLTLHAFRQKALDYEANFESANIALLTARDSLKKAEGSYDPTLSASSTFAVTESLSTDEKTRTRTHQIGVSQLVEPLGTTVTLGYTQIASHARSEQLWGDLETGSLTVSQPLLKDFQTDSYRLAVDQADLALDQAHQTRERTLHLLLQTVDNLYWSHWKIYQTWEISKELYALSEQQVRDATRLARGGVSSTVEIRRAEAFRAQNVDTILNARNALLLSQRLMERQIPAFRGPAGGRKMYLPVSEPDFQQSPPPLDADALIQTALETRPDRLAQVKAYQSSLESVGYQENQLLPSLTAAYSYSYDRLNIDASGISSRGAPDWSVSLTVSMPLGNNAAEASLSTAKYSARTELRTLTDLERTIERQVLDAIDNLNLARDRIQAAKAELAIARDIYKAEKRLFSRGLRTSTEVATAARAVATARTRQATAMQTYQTATTSLKVATGDMDISFFPGDLSKGWEEGLVDNTQDGAQ